ncbi:GGDEF domain-containing protein [Pseudomonas sp. C27(2019)]|uniref:GGDEF domain-containing protein n=1 Tax=Pseudomonas sp. C27(2019) TaxID=2604941 RepID=UPI0012487A62|nr:GGDEF domain-containing protein [Pseudomonas sp. C27(2019)]QEY58644.1 GGDEF domain-containing protein [Pseudomonas sp. C27(2019)]
MNNPLQVKYQLSILSLIGIIAVLGVLPFAVIRYLQGNLLAAIINAALALGIIALVAYAHRSSKPQSASIIIALFVNAGVVLMAVTNGINSFLWVYPVFATTFFLTKPLVAFCICLAAGVSLVALSDILDVISLDSYVMTSVVLSLSALAYARHNEKQLRLLETLNTIDPLTGALNRRALTSDIQAALSNSERNNTEQLLAIIDMDHFKSVNDKYGHAAGDKVLKQFVAITLASIRKYDRLYRFGGEEFVLLIPDVNHKQQRMFIHNLRSAIKSKLKAPGGEEVTVSFGVAPWVPGTTVDTWLKRADEALYRAKASGRDRAVFSNDILDSH